MLRCLIGILSVCTLAFCGAVGAQEFPTRPLRIVTAAVGGATDLVALLGGEVQMSFATSSSVAAHIKSGKLRALAIGTAKPSALAPGLPTVAESGLPGYESASNAGMFVPGKTPARLITLLNREIVQALNRQEVRDLLFKDGTQVVGSSPGEFAAAIKAEMTSLGKVIKAAGIHTN